MSTESPQKRMKIAEENSESQQKKPHCLFWVARKSRYCKMVMKAGHKYCGEHVPTSETQPLDDQRVVCPLDASHSVFRFKLAKHLRVCNARKKELPVPHVKRNLNAGAPEADGEDDAFKLRELPPEELERVTKIVGDLYAQHVSGKIASEVQSHRIFEAELKVEGYGDDKIRHLLQASSIFGILESRGLLAPETCFIDLGAGKGHLSYWLSKLIVDDKMADSKVLVVDRASHRHKRDNLFKEIGVAERVRVDLADLDLKELPFERCKQVVGVSKHLCGRATDFALRCLINGNEGAVKTRGFLICLCCHHQITFDSFLGREWLESLGIDRRTFNVVIKMASWCICGDGRRREQRKAEGVFSDEKTKERAEIGWKCKRLLDYARVRCMNEAGYDAGLSFYVDKSQTLENVCIVGKLREAVDS